MIQLKAANTRGHTATDWLDSHHSFSFGDYVDPSNRGFSDLRVINEDWVKPGKGFSPHAHRDMEILTYVLEGTLEHKDSMGNGSLIRAGEFQRMSAGTGVTHGEYNPSASESVHLLQIWILPEVKGLTPEYEQRAFNSQEQMGRFRLIASHDGLEESLTLHQDVSIYVSTLLKDQDVSHHLPAGRAAWIHIARGQVQLNDLTLHAGDGLALINQHQVKLTGRAEQSEVLLFDLRPPQ